MKSVGPPGRVPPISGGEESVWHFANVTLRNRRYIFLVVGTRPYSSSAIEQKLQTDLKELGLQLGPWAAVVRAAPERADETRAEVLKKPWDENFLQQMKSTTDPFLLIIARDFAMFDPREHPWGAVWLSSYAPEELYRIFSVLAQKTKEGDDLFAYLSALARKTKVKKWLQYFELRPNTFGISVDVNAILADMAGA